MHTPGDPPIDEMLKFNGLNGILTPVKLQVKFTASISIIPLNEDFMASQNG